MEDALFGAAVALFCVYIGHRLTISKDKRRSISLEKGLYSEFELLNKYLKGWLNSLSDEFMKPVRYKYTECILFDFKLVDDFILELVAVDKILTIEQRFLINNMKNRLDSIKIKILDREKDIKWDETNKNCYVERHHTAQLIKYVAELVYYIDKLDKERNNLKFSDDTDVFEHVKYGLEKSGVDFDGDFESDLKYYLK